MLERIRGGKQENRLKARNIPRGTEGGDLNSLEYPNQKDENKGAAPVIE